MRIITESHFADTLAPVDLMTQCISRPFPMSFAFPLGDV